MKWKYDIRCSECGRFIKSNSDSSTPYGGPLSTEPPDPEFYCSECVDRLTRRYIGRGWVPVAYIPAKWHGEVKKVLDARGSEPER